MSAAPNDIDEALRRAAEAADKIRKAREKGGKTGKGAPGAGSARSQADSAANDAGQASQGDKGAQESGAAILADVEAFLSRFVSYPSEHTRIAHALWIAHTHLMECWDSTPRIAFLSPEPGSGKTRALEVSELLVPNPVEAINASAAYLFRRISAPDGAPTILFDEADTLFGPKAKEHEEIRGVLNAGHRRGAVAGRCVVRGKTVEIEELPAYCAVAIAGLGDLPDTILTRSVIVRMRRRAPSERVEPFRRRLALPVGYALRDRLAAWARRVAPKVMGVYPVMPESITDRPADVWEALLSVADAAGGTWPTRASDAAVALVTAAQESSPSLRLRLLSDVRIIFGKANALYSQTIVDGLVAGTGLEDDAPWADLRGKPLTKRDLASMLAKYDIKPAKVRESGGNPLQGYTRAALWDAWQRYLAPPRKNPEQPEQPEQPANFSGNSGGSGVPDDEDVPEQRAMGPEHSGYPRAEEVLL
jgi:hypothetical protein